MSAECIWFPGHCPDWPEHDCCGCGERGRKEPNLIGRGLPLRYVPGSDPKCEQAVDPIRVDPEFIPWIKAGLIPRREVSVEELRKRYQR